MQQENHSKVFLVIEKRFLLKCALFLTLFWQWRWKIKILTSSCEIFIKGCPSQYHKLVGDGYCNDETNNIHCAYDFGDCCYSCISKAFCTDCKCLTGNNAEEINHPLIGDGYCQDEINNDRCNFDGGDCCGSCINTNFCSKCACHNNITENGIRNPQVGDGFCNDKTNNFDCGYDGGDCCLDINRDLCSQCKCYCQNPELIGNGICNNETNNAVCSYDGGDCCGPALSCKCVCSSIFPEKWELLKIYLNWLIDLKE